MAANPMLITSESVVHTAALRYFSPPVGAYWAWEDDARVIVWEDGTTIAFREEIEQILAALESDGLPPFSAIVLLLSSCRGVVPLPSVLAAVGEGLMGNSEFSIADRTQEALAEVAVKFIKKDTLRLSAVLDRLQLISQFPKELLSSTEAKVRLCQMVFEGNSDRSKEMAKVSGAALCRYPLQNLVFPKDERSSQDPESLIQGLRSLGEGIGRVSEEALRLFSKTGLEGLSELAGDAVEVPLPLQTRRFLEQLYETPDFHALAKVARDVMSATYLPQGLSQVDEAFAGGFSDLSNRGSFHQLLLSELANDDLTLAMRLALNEALYLKRDPPVRPVPGHFCVLIDDGIRMWGVPRLFAAAVALALLAKSNKSSRISCFRAVAGGMKPVSLLSKDGLLEHLSALETYPYPESSLFAMSQHCRRQGEPVEIVLITHKEVLGDAEFLAALGLLELFPLYIATVERSGEFQLFLQGASTRTSLCRAKIELAELLNSPEMLSPRQQPLENIHRELPVFLQQQPPPLLLPVHEAIEYALHRAGGGGLCLTKSHRIWYWENASQGGRELPVTKLHGETLWFELDDRECLSLIKYLPEEPLIYLTVVRDMEGQCEVERFELIRREVPSALYCNGDWIFLIWQDEISAFNRTNGLLADTLLLPSGFTHLNGRYFTSDDSSKWFFIAWNGQSLLLEPLELAEIQAATRENPLITIFDQANLSDGPWLLFSSGKVLSCGSGYRRNFEIDQVILRENVYISSDGKRIHLHQENESDRLLNLDKGTSLRVSRRSAKLMLDPRPSVPTKNLLRQRIDRIAFSSQGNLLVRTKEIQWLELKLDSQGQNMRFVPLKEVPTVRRGEKSFFDCLEPEQSAYEMELAQWDSGSRAWLDNRGLLHLRSAERSLPEISLVLTYDAVAAWSSEGAMTGARFFTGNKAKVPAKKICDNIRRFALKIN